jgi:NADPH:quinone reductase-like Zn-dependent oxidoreductase
VVDVTATGKGVTMKAIVQDRYGSPDLLQLRDVDTPVVGDDEVLVRVHSAGVDQGVWHIMAGLPYSVRLAGYGIRAPKNPVPGADLAGVVEAVGKGVTRFQPGDEVFGIGRGSFAEYACARARPSSPPGPQTSASSGQQRLPSLACLPFRACAITGECVRARRC